LIKNLKSITSLKIGVAIQDTRHKQSKALSRMSHKISSKLQELATMTIDGEQVCKLDYIATIYINDYMYFTVYRRYNNPYEIIVEDYAGEHHFHKDLTIKESIASILCLSDDEAEKMYIVSAVSFEYNMYIYDDTLKYTWVQMASTYSGVYLKLAGILEAFNDACYKCSAILSTNDVNDYFPAFADGDDDGDDESVNLIVVTPSPPQTPKRAESDSKELSMRHSDVKKRRAEAVKQHKEVLAEERKKSEKPKRKRHDFDNDNDEAEKTYMLRSKRKPTQ
jgi:hypothetical protein